MSGCRVPLGCDIPSECSCGMFTGPDVPPGWRIVAHREPVNGDYYLNNGVPQRSWRNNNHPDDRYEPEYWWIVERVTEQEVEDISSEPKLEGRVVFGDEVRNMDGSVNEAETKAMRVFASGATRNVEVDPDYHGFLSPLALHAYGEYMHRHRLQADGSLRDSDNWQKGIPNDAFVRSLVRHVHDIQLVFDGYGELARQDDRDENVLLAHLSAALFNVQGMLHNVMLALLEDERNLQEIIDLAVAVAEAGEEQA